MKMASLKFANTYSNRTNTKSIKSPEERTLLASANGKTLVRNIKFTPHIIDDEEMLE